VGYSLQKHQHNVSAVVGEIDRLQLKPFNGLSHGISETSDFLLTCQSYFLHFVELIPILLLLMHIAHLYKILLEYKKKNKKM
jgi:hypothetical protein